MSRIVRTAADILYPFILIFGLYIVIHGHLTPGGGFQGGAVIATGSVLLLVAFRYSELTGDLRKGWMKIFESGGLLLFIGTALAALLVGGVFFFNWLANTGSLFGIPVAFGPNPGEIYTAGVIPVMNLAVGIEVWGGLSLIVMYMMGDLEEGGERS
ncbi:MAG: MnhB domain-containing protein [Methanomicrobiales archaeon]|nr:MnhB domain-containing protein [Methanomicrobiales archaeon]